MVEQLSRLDKRDRSGLQALRPPPRFSSVPPELAARHDRARAPVRQLNTLIASIGSDPPARREANVREAGRLGGEVAAIARSSKSLAARTMRAASKGSAVERAFGRRLARYRRQTHRAHDRVLSRAYRRIDANLERLRMLDPPGRAEREHASLVDAYRQEEVTRRGEVAANNRGDVTQSVHFARADVRAFYAVVDRRAALIRKLRD